MTFPGIASSLPLDLGLLETWLEEQQATPEILDTFLADVRSPRLGIYHEALWQYFLQHYPEVTLIAHNVAVRDGGCTLGEFDYIVQHNPTQQVYHIEVATKYYLSFPSAGGDVWFGPSLQDRFDLKASHLLNHQIQLSDTPAGRAALTKLGVNTVTKVVSVGGMLFYGEAPCALPEHIHWDHARGKHLTLQTFSAMASNHTWMVVPRYDWLAPLLLNSDQGFMDHGQLYKMLAKAFEERHQPLMVASLIPSATHHGSWQEHTRLFITPDDWEAEAASAINASRG